MRALIAVLFLLLPLPAEAHEFDLGELQIIHPSIPATPLDSTTAHIYMAFVNNGTEPERLLGIETPYGSAVLERTVTAADGTVSTQKMAWIDIPAGETVLLTQGEMRGRVEGVAHPLLDGGQLDGAFVFEKRGRFKMFFMIDPVEEIEEPASVTAAPAMDRATETVAIADTLRIAVGADAMIAPVAISGDFAIAGWTKGEEGARAFLRKRDGKWQVLIWSGPSLLLPATMNSLGVSSGTADSLRSELKASETALGSVVTSRFDAFPGTVLLK